MLDAASSAGTRDIGGVVPAGVPSQFVIVDPKWMPFIARRYHYEE